MSRGFPLGVVSNVPGYQNALTRGPARYGRRGTGCVTPVRPENFGSQQPLESQRRRFSRRDRRNRDYLNAPAPQPRNTSAAEKPRRGGGKSQTARRGAIRT